MNKQEFSSTFYIKFWLLHFSLTAEIWNLYVDLVWLC